MRIAHAVFAACVRALVVKPSRHRRVYYIFVCIMETFACCCVGDGRLICT